MLFQIVVRIKWSNAKDFETFKVLLSILIFIGWPELENIFQFPALATDLQGVVDPSGPMIILPLYTL